MTNKLVTFLQSVQEFNIFRTYRKDFIKKTRNKKLKIIRKLGAAPR
jgi:hypothetical protein